MLWVSQRDDEGKEIATLTKCTISSLEQHHWRKALQLWAFALVTQPVQRRVGDAGGEGSLFASSPTA